MFRQHFCQRIQEAFQVHNIVALLGPRQCGKTTLARQYMDDYNSSSRVENYFDLERATDIARLQQPEVALGDLSGLVVIDEVQYVPELFRTLRVLVDRPNNEATFLILGSASRELIRQSSESLAGRIQYIELTPFNFSEAHDLEKLWQRGGFPNSFLAETDKHSQIWREAYVKTFLEQDIPNLGINIPANNLHRFWMMLAHYHGNIFNSSELGRSLGLSHTTIKRYVDILSGTFMVRQLQPWFENISKRQVKSPKIYFRDSGLFHTLIGIDSKTDLLVHPKLGASWEGFALEEVIRHLEAEPHECFFWATQAQQQAELDLMIVRGQKRIGFEFKYQDAPRSTKSMHIALKDLKLDELIVIYPGQVDYQLFEKMNVKGLKSFLEQPE